MPLVAAFAVAAFSAQAADMYVPGASVKDGPMYDAVPSWSGFYAGVNGGYAWGAVSSRLNASATDITAATAQAVSSKLWTDNGFGGGQLGYNLQRDRFVLGVEADIQGGSIAGRTHSEAVSSNITTDAWARSTLDWFGTVRGRAGYAYGGSLVYATGGFAFGGARDSLSQSVNSGAAINSASANATLTGYVVGGGVETALTPSWSVKAEYQYINLGSTNLSTANDGIAYTPCGVTTCTGNGDASAKFDHIYHTVRLGLNYKINQPYEALK